MQCTAVPTLVWSFEFANAVLVLHWVLEDARKQVLVVFVDAQRCPSKSMVSVVQASEVWGKSAAGVATAEL